MKVDEAFIDVDILSGRRSTVSVVINGRTMERASPPLAQTNEWVKTFYDSWGIAVVKTNVGGRVTEGVPPHLDSDMQRIDFVIGVDLAADDAEKSVWLPVDKITVTAIRDRITSEYGSEAVPETAYFGPVCSGVLYREMFGGTLDVKNDYPKIERVLGEWVAAEEKMAEEFKTWEPPKPRRRSTFAEKAAFWMLQGDRARRRLKSLQERLEKKNAQISRHDGTNRDLSNHFHLGMVGGSGPAVNFRRMNARKERHAEKSWKLWRERKELESQILGVKMRIAYCEARVEVNQRREQE